MEILTAGRPTELLTIGEPGAMLCGMDPNGTARAIQVDTEGRVVPAPHGLNGTAGFALLATLFLVAYLVGRSHR